MSLSLATLLSLPLPTTLKANTALATRLAVSEQTNLVVKKNAGLSIENVKHPPELIQDVNRFYFGDETATKLMFTHRNSYFD